MWKSYLQNITKNLVYRIYKDFLKTNKKNMNNQIEKDKKLELTLYKEKNPNG